MKNKDYQYSCYVKLFKLLKPFLTDEKINNQIDELEDNSDVDVLWPLISTGLLMSEKKYEDKKIYEYLDDTSFDMFRNLLEELEPIEAFESISGNCLLDRKGNVICDIARFYRTDLIDEYLDDLVLDEDNIDYDFEAASAAKKDFDDLNLEYDESYLFHEANDLIIKNKELDFKELFKRVRIALAHSHYEFLNKDYIRIYHYKNEESENPDDLDLNVVLNTEVILTILNELNEIGYEKDSKVDKNNSYSLIITELINQRSESGTTWNALGYYKYLRDEYFSYDGDFVEVNNNNSLKMELIILSLFNILLLGGFNNLKKKRLSNPDLDLSFFDNIDLSDIIIDSTIKNAIETKAIKSYEELKKNYEKKLDEIRNNIDFYDRTYKSRPVENEYFNGLVDKKAKAEQDYKVKEEIYNDYVNNRSKIIDRKIKYMILNHLRNSMAHGNIKFSNGDEVIIDDYDEKNVLTFKGNVSVINLLNIMLNKSLVSNLLDIELENKKVLKI